MNYDRWAEGGLALRAWALPEEALSLFRQAPAKLFGSNVVCVAKAMPVALQRGLVPTWLNIRNIAGEFGFGMDYCQAAFQAMTSESSVFMMHEPERCILSIREAYLDRTRQENVKLLGRLQSDPSAFRSKLEQMLRQERSIAPDISLPKVESVEELEAAQVGHSDAVIGDYLLNETGLCFIHAADGAGKTLLAMDLAACIATGGDWLNWTTAESRVLYFQGELDRGWWKQRNSRLRQAHECQISNLQWCHERWSLGRFDSKTWQTTTPGLDKLQQMLELHQPHVVFIDPLSKYYGLQENSNDQANEFVARLRDLRAALGVTFVIVHHDGKAQDGKPATMRGASAMRGDSDLSMQLVVRDSGKYVNLIFDKVRHGPKPAPIKLGRTRHGFFERLKDASDGKNQAQGSEVHDEKRQANREANGPGRSEKSLESDGADTNQDRSLAGWQ